MRRWRGDEEEVGRERGEEVSEGGREGGEGENGALPLAFRYNVCLHGACFSPHKVWTSLHGIII